MSEGKRTAPRGLVGRVVSNKASKTITVLVERRVEHPLYKKYVRRSSKVHAHDEDGTCRPGDIVRVVECRPVSKTKTWRLDEVLERREA